MTYDPSNASCPGLVRATWTRTVPREVARTRPGHDSLVVHVSGATKTPSPRRFDHEHIAGVHLGLVGTSQHVPKPTRALHPLPAGRSVGATRQSERSGDAA